MLKISLMDQSDLEFAYEIEKEVNPTPWSKKNFFSLRHPDQFILEI